MTAAQDAVATLRRFHAAWNAHDVEAIMAFFAEEAEFWGARGPTPQGEVLRGHTSIRDGVIARLERTPDLAFVEDEYRPCGENEVLASWTMTGTGVGGPICVRGCDLYRLRDGKIVLKDSYLKAMS